MKIRKKNNLILKQREENVMEYFFHIKSRLQNF
jgi:hypothetical protein